ncbi:MAG: hypothetical protein ABI459_04950 [Deltaproteobacteria bacterium]
MKINAQEILAMRQAAGIARGDYLIDVILNDLLDALVTAEAGLAGGSAKQIGKCAARVVRQAARLQLDDLAVCAIAVGELAERDTDPSFPAVVQRMVRCGEASVSAVWQILALQVRT